MHLQPIQTTKKILHLDVVIFNAFFINGFSPSIIQDVINVLKSCSFLLLQNC